MFETNTDAIGGGGQDLDLNRNLALNLNLPSHLLLGGD